MYHDELCLPVALCSFYVMDFIICEEACQMHFFLLFEWYVDVLMFVEPY